LRSSRELGYVRPIDFAGDQRGNNRQKTAFAGSALLLALLIVEPLAMAGETYYRWTDEQGNIVMSDRPPSAPGIDYKTVVTSGSSLRPTSPGNDTALENNRATMNRPVTVEGNVSEGTGPAVNQRQVERNPEACAEAKRAIQELNNRPRVRVYDEQGELKYLSDEEKAELRRRAELTIELHCER
jgi:hypothetical protein